MEQGLTHVPKQLEEAGSSPGRTEGLKLRKEAPASDASPGTVQTPAKRLLLGVTPPTNLQVRDHGTAFVQLWRRIPWA